jgi:hypothetical protein
MSEQTAVSNWQFAVGKQQLNNLAIKQFNYLP